MGKKKRSKKGKKKGGNDNWRNHPHNVPPGTRPAPGTEIYAWSSEAENDNANAQRVHEPANQPTLKDSALSSDTEHPHKYPPLNPGTARSVLSQGTPERYVIPARRPNPENGILLGEAPPGKSSMFTHTLLLFTYTDTLMAAPTFERAPAQEYDPRRPHFDPNAHGNPTCCMRPYNPYPAAQSPFYHFEALARHYREQEVKMNGVQRSRGVLQGRLNDANVRIGYLQAEVDRPRAQRMELIDLLNVLERDVERLRADVREERERFGSLHNDLKRVSEERDEARERAEQLNVGVLVLEKCLEEMETENDQLRESGTSQREMIDNLRTENEKLKAKLGKFRCMLAEED